MNSKTIIECGDVPDNYILGHALNHPRDHFDFELSSCQTLDFYYQGPVESAKYMAELRKKLVDLDNKRVGQRALSFGQWLRIVRRWGFVVKVRRVDAI